MRVCVDTDGGWVGVEQRFYRFHLAEGEDMLSAKGILLVHTGNVIVGNTHLNANKRCRSVRSSQVEELLEALRSFQDDCANEGICARRVPKQSN